MNTLPQNPLIKPLDKYRAFLNNPENTQKSQGRFYLDPKNPIGLRAGQPASVFGELLGATVGMVYSNPEERTKNNALKEDLITAIQAEYPKASKVAQASVAAIPDLRTTDAQRIIQQAYYIDAAASLIEIIIPTLQKIEETPERVSYAREIYEAVESILPSIQAGKDPQKCLHELQSLQQRAEDIALGNLSSLPGEKAPQRPFSASPTPPVTPYSSRGSIGSPYPQNHSPVPSLRRAPSAYSSESLHSTPLTSFGSPISGRSHQDTATVTKTIKDLMTESEQAFTTFQQEEETYQNLYKELYGDPISPLYRNKAKEAYCEVQQIQKMLTQETNQPSLEELSFLQQSATKALSLLKKQNTEQPGMITSLLNVKARWGSEGTRRDITHKIASIKTAKVFISQHSRNLQIPIQQHAKGPVILAAVQKIEDDITKGGLPGKHEMALSSLITTLKHL